MMLNKIKSWIGKRYPLVDPMELEQAKIRIFVGLVILAYLIYRNFSAIFGNEQLISSVEMVAFLIDFIFLGISFVLLFSIVANLFNAKTRRLFGAILDQSTTTVFMIQAGEAGFTVIGIYLWVAFGNGFRYGKSYLFFAQALSVVGFAITTHINPYWLNHEPIVFSIFLMLIALPVYVSTLITRLNVAKQYAERASELKTQFVAVMSHEIRTPLNGIVGISTLLKTSPLNLEQKELITTLDSSSKQLLAILNNVLDFAKIEEDKLTLENRPFSLDELVTDTQSVFCKIAEVKHLVFSSSSDVQGLNLEGDAHKLQQVVTNLVGNAIKFTERGSVVFTIRTLALSESTCQLRFEVVDTGIGIADDKRQFIFDSFTQADASTTRRFGGSGLGLTISKHIVEQMGGKIEFDSKQGIGTRFWFDLTFNLATQDAMQETKPNMTLAEAKQAMRKLKVLICEDDATNQKILQKLLELFNHEVKVVDSADAMLDTLEVESFDLVISDLNMAGMTGIDAIKTYRFIKPEDKQTKFILFTADATVSTKKEASNAGFDTFLSKPVDADTLFATIAHQFDMPLITTDMLSNTHNDISNVIEEQPEVDLDNVLNQETLKELELLGGNDPLFVHRLLKNYLLDSEKLVEKIVRAVEQRRYVEAQEYCHALRGNSLSIGARNVFESTDAIEKAAPSVLRFRGASMTGQLKTDFEAVRASVELYLSRRQVATSQL